MSSTLKSLSKKIGQFQQWTGEKLGGTQKTDTSEEFKRLDTEVVGRLESAGRLNKVLQKIVKHLCIFKLLTVAGKKDTTVDKVPRTPMYARLSLYTGKPLVLLFKDMDYLWERILVMVMY